MRVKALGLLLSMWIGLATCGAQTGGPPQHPLPGQPPSDADDEARAEIRRDMEKKANKERQEQIRSDTDKLLKLATELKAYVDKSNENTLSLDVIKKAEEIEKLAHNVKEKMKD